MMDDLDFGEMDPQEIKELKHKFAQWEAQEAIHAANVKSILDNMSFGLGISDKDLDEAIQTVYSKPELFSKGSIEDCLTSIEELYCQLEDAINELQENIERYAEEEDE